MKTTLRLLALFAGALVIAAADAPPPDAQTTALSAEVMECVQSRVNVRVQLAEARGQLAKMQAELETLRAAKEQKQ